MIGLGIIMFVVAFLGGMAGVLVGTQATRTGINRAVVRAEIAARDAEQAARNARTIATILEGRYDPDVKPYGPERGEGGGWISGGSLP